MLIHFALTRADLLAVLDLVVGIAWPLRYTVTGNRLCNDFESYLDPRRIPDLGEAAGDQQAGCTSFLLTRAEVVPAVRVLDVPPKRYLIDQFINNDAVTMTPAGLRGQTALIEGSVGNAWPEPGAKELMSAFAKAVRKVRFRKVASVFVGTEAEKLARSGCRITDSLNSPKEFDVQLPD